MGTSEFSAIICCFPRTYADHAKRVQKSSYLSNPLHWQISTDAPLK